MYDAVGNLMQLRHKYERQIKPEYNFEIQRFAHLNFKLNRSGSGHDGLLLKSPFAYSETIFDKSKARFRHFQNSPFGLDQLDSLLIHLAKIYWQNPSQ
jgi:hypothetical protein